MKMFKKILISLFVIIFVSSLVTLPSENVEATKKVSVFKGDFLQKDSKYNKIYPNSNKDYLALSKYKNAVIVSMEKRKGKYSYAIIKHGSNFERVYRIPSGKKVVLPLDHGPKKNYKVMLLSSKNADYNVEGYVMKEKKFSYKQTNFSTKRQYLSNNFVIQKDNYQIQKLLKSSHFKNWKKWSDAKKVKTTHDYFAKRYEYSDKVSAWQDVNWYTPYYLQRVQNKDMICYDAASMMAAMLRSMNVQTKFVGGYSRGGDDPNVYHAWNEVYVDGKWKIVDLTFDLRFRFLDDFAYPDNPLYKKAKDYTVKEYF